MQDFHLEIPNSLKSYILLSKSYLKPSSRMAISESRSSSRLLAWLQLMRLPNVFTAIADVAMGFWFTHETLSPVWGFAALLISTSCLYVCGMILNDVFDVEQDRRERPRRPLPSGRITSRDAAAIGRTLLILGVIVAYLCMAVIPTRRPGFVAMF